ncbi:MAG TPA: hypothetical protein VK752_13350 [Bryobacteraceae bacterium]|jgi:hypothetical protein|nr:hypothetical protein [Bryobacteraceae bacterium]
MSINKIDNRVMVAFGFLAILALIATPVWNAREQWQFGAGRDDGIYVATAKSIAAGGGYHQENLPGHPYHTKYPPLFPLFMSIAWRLEPHFPQTLETASILQACLLPVYLSFLLLVLRQLGFSWRRTFLVAALTFSSFGFVLLAVTLYSELLFGCFLLASIWATERSTTVGDSSAWRWALAGGTLAGLTYLTRNAGVPLLAAAPIFFFVRKRFRLSLFFFAPVLPMVAGWYLWGHLHPSVIAKTLGVPYLDEFLKMVRGTDPFSHFLQEAATFSASTAESFFPGLMDFLFGIPLHHLVLAASIVGGIRLGRRKQWPLVLIFGALYLIMVLLWTFEDLSRLVVPIWPIVLIGIAEEASHLADLFAQSIKRPALKQVPRWALIAAGLCLALRNEAVTSRRISSVVADEKEARQKDLPVYAWIRDHASGDTVVLAWKDGLSYQYTGVPSSHDLFVSMIPETEVLVGRRLPFIPPPAPFQQVLLVLLGSDLGGNVSDGRLDSFRATAASVPGSKLEYSSPIAWVYGFPVPR